MSIRFSCPECQKEFQVPDDLAGKRIRCKECSTMMIVPDDAAPAPPGESRPRRRERDDESPIESEERRPRRRDRERRGRKKNSGARVLLILLLVASLLACLLGGGGFAAWYFGFRDTWPKADLAYLPDHFTELRVINYDKMKSGASFGQAQNCPAAKDHFAFTRTPSGKTLDVTRALVAETANGKVTVLTVRNPLTIQDLVDANAKRTEGTVGGKAIYDVGETSYVIDGKRVLIGPGAVLRAIVQRNGQPRISGPITEGMKEADFSRAEVAIVDFNQNPATSMLRNLGAEVPFAIVAELDYDLPMSLHVKMLCSNDKAAEQMTTMSNAGMMGRSSKIQLVAVKRKGSLVTVEGRANDPCDALGAGSW